MTITVLELRQLIADNCDASQPLRVVSRDVGKKADKHSVVRVDENYPIRLGVSPGRYDERAVIEFAYYSDCEVLTSEAFLDALDELLEEVPKATVGWVYFFYFPMKYVTLLRRVKLIECSLLDTRDVHKIYMSDDEPNTLVIEGAYEFSSFDT